MQPCLDAGPTEHNRMDRGPGVASSTTTSVPHLCAQRCLSQKLTLPTANRLGGHAAGSQGLRLHSQAATEYQKAISALREQNLADRDRFGVPSTGPDECCSNANEKCGEETVVFRVRQ